MHELDRKQLTDEITSNASFIEAGAVHEGYLFYDKTHRLVDVIVDWLEKRSASPREAIERILDAAGAPTSTTINDTRVWTIAERVQWLADELKQWKDRSAHAERIAEGLIENEFTNGEIIAILDAAGVPKEIPSKKPKTIFETLTLAERVRWVVGRVHEPHHCNAPVLSDLIQEVQDALSKAGVPDMRKDSFGAAIATMPLLDRIACLIEQREVAKVQTLSYVDSVSRAWGEPVPPQPTAPCVDQLRTPSRVADLCKRFAYALNCVSAENESDTPDFILADYLYACLRAFEIASNHREKWYGWELSIGGPRKIGEQPTAEPPTAAPAQTSAPRHPRKRAPRVAHSTTGASILENALQDTPTVTQNSFLAAGH